MAGDPAALARAPETWPAAGSSRANRGPPGASPTLSLTLRSAVLAAVPLDAGQTRPWGGSATVACHPQGHRLPRAWPGQGWRAAPSLPAAAARAVECEGAPPRPCPPRLSSPSRQRAAAVPSAGGDGALGLALRGRHGTHECLSFCRSRDHAGASSPLAGLLSAPQPRLSRDCFTNGVEAAHRCGPRNPRGPWGPEGSGWIVNRERPRRSGPKRGPRPSGGLPRPQHVRCRP